MNLNDRISELEQELDRFEDDDTLNDIISEISRLEKCRCQRCDGSGIEYFNTNYPDFVIDACPDCRGSGERD
jgi:DnaJ-class molecular chaperone